MKAGQADEAEEKKREVESINKVAGSAEEDLNKVWRLMRMQAEVLLLLEDMCQTTWLSKGWK